MLQQHNRTMFTILSLVILLFVHSIQADTSLYLWGVPFTANNTQPNVLSPTRFPHDKVSSFVQIESGEGHTLLLTRDGKVFSMGDNRFGQCGVPTSELFLQHPVHISEIPEDIKAISAGGFHSLVLGASGRVYSFGSNSNGQLGLDKFTRDLPSTHVPSLISTGFFAQTNDTVITSIAAGHFHSLVVTSRKHLYGFGSNMDFQLAMDSKRNYFHPDLVFKLPNVVAVSAGTKHSVAIDLSGNIYTWGSREQCQTGDVSKPEFMHQRNPVRISNWDKSPVLKGCNATSVYSKDDGTIAIVTNGIFSFMLAWGVNPRCSSIYEDELICLPIILMKLPDADIFQTISISNSHTLLLTKTGRILACGDNNVGQLGIGSTNPVNMTTSVSTPTGELRVLAVSTLVNRSLALMEHTCIDNCNKNGRCFSQNKCECFHPFFGPNCQHTITSIVRTTVGVTLGLGLPATLLVCVAITIVLVAKRYYNKEETYQPLSTIVTSYTDPVETHTSIQQPPAKKIKRS